MTTKDYLNQISYYNKIIDNKLIEITQYKELSYSISAVVNEERVMSSSKQAADMSDLNKWKKALTNL